MLAVWVYSTHWAKSSGCVAYIAEPWSMMEPLVCAGEFNEASATWTTTEIWLGASKFTLSACQLKRNHVPCPIESAKTLERRTVSTFSRLRGRHGKQGITFDATHCQDMSGSLYQHRNQSDDIAWVMEMNSRPFFIDTLERGLSNGRVMARTEIIGKFVKWGQSRRRVIFCFACLAEQGCSLPSQITP